MCCYFYVLKQLNPQQSNRTYAIQWYFLLRWVFSGLSYPLPLFFGAIPKAGVESPRTLQPIIATYKCTWVWFNLHPRWPTDLQVSQKEQSVKCGSSETWACKYAKTWAFVGLYLVQLVLQFHTNFTTVKAGRYLKCQFHGETKTIYEFYLSDFLNLKRSRYTI